jgi:hypothetical protein
MALEGRGRREPRLSRFAPPPLGKHRTMSAQERDPHHALNTPVGEPDPTEWPDPYDHREDPRDPVDPDEAPFGEQPHPPTGSRSTSAPHPSQDPEAVPWEGPKRDKLDD